MGTVFQIMTAINPHANRVSMHPLNRTVRPVDSDYDLGIDLVVIGATSHGIWHRMVTGSAASGVLECLPSGPSSWCDLTED
jgi:nucleotide-binding universal stress UspA family protein